MLCREVINFLCLCVVLVNRNNVGWYRDWRNKKQLRKTSLSLGELGCDVEIDIKLFFVRSVFSFNRWTKHGVLQLVGLQKLKRYIFLVSLSLVPQTQLQISPVSDFLAPLIFHYFCIYHDSFFFSVFHI